MGLLVSYFKIKMFPMHYTGVASPIPAVSELYCHGTHLKDWKFFATHQGGAKKDKVHKKRKIGAW